MIYNNNYFADRVCEIKDLILVMLFKVPKYIILAKIYQNKRNDLKKLAMDVKM